MGAVGGGSQGTDGGEEGLGAAAVGGGGGGRRIDVAGGGGGGIGRNDCGRRAGSGFFLNQLNITCDTGVPPVRAM